MIHEANAGCARASHDFAQSVQCRYSGWCYWSIHTSSNSCSRWHHRDIQVHLLLGYRTVQYSNVLYRIERGLRLGSLVTVLGRTPPRPFPSHPGLYRAAVYLVLRPPTRLSRFQHKLSPLILAASLCREHMATQAPRPRSRPRPRPCLIYLRLAQLPPSSTVSSKLSG